MKAHQKKCSDVMTRDPVCCLPSDTAEKVARLMKTNDIGPVPIVDDLNSKRLVGIVTDRDLALKVVGECRDPRSTRVESLETRDVVVCHPDDDIKEVLETMAKHRLRRIPVVDENGRILGIVAQADVAEKAEAKAVGETVREISKHNGRD